MASIAVRNLSDLVHTWLRRRASVQGTSVEQEIRTALEAVAVDDTSLPYRVHVAQRLKNLLDLVNQGIRGESSIKPSHIAVMLNHNTGGLVDDWFNARSEPDFDSLNKICELFGANSKWLIHGDGQPFAVDSIDFTTGKHGFELLLRKAPTHIRLIRAENEDGWLAFVLTVGDNKYITMRTPFNISANVGAGGMARLVATSNLCAAFWCMTGSDNFITSSHSVHEDDYLSLIRGEKYPGAIISKSRSCHWWEDIWDFRLLPDTAEENVPAQDPNWPGFIKLLGQIKAYVDAPGWALRDREWAAKNSHETARDLGYRVYTSLLGKID